MACVWNKIIKRSRKKQETTACWYIKLPTQESLPDNDEIVQNVEDDDVEFNENDSQATIIAQVVGEASGLSDVDNFKSENRRLDNNANSDQREFNNCFQNELYKKEKECVSRDFERLGRDKENADDTGCRSYECNDEIDELMKKLHDIWREIKTLGSVNELGHLSNYESENNKLRRKLDTAEGKVKTLEAENQLMYEKMAQHDSIQNLSSLPTHHYQLMKQRSCYCAQGQDEGQGEWQDEGQTMLPCVYRSNEAQSIKRGMPLFKCCSCPASCVLDCTMALLKIRKSNICRNKFIRMIAQKTGDHTKCVHYLHHFCELGYLEKVTPPEGLDVCGNLNAKLEGVMSLLRTMDEYSALLVIKYNEHEYEHCLLTMLKKDANNPAVVMQVHDAQLKERWPQYVEDMQDIVHIDAYRIKLSKTELEKEFASCSQECCHRELTKKGQQQEL